MTNSRFLISESEKNRIKSLYGLNSKDDFVFDFVLTENNKYVILMDNVFVKGGNGESIGSIWKNTNIFNELILDFLSKNNQITESIQEDIKSIIKDFGWTKDIVREWLNTKETITEGVLDWIKDKSNMAKDAVTKLAKWAFNGVVDMLRWIRRNAMTNIGMVIDIVVSILSVKTNAVVWILIVLLDIYEIGTGDFDPKDPDRKNSPYIGLISDSISALFTSAIGFAFKKASGVILKKGIQQTPNMAKWLRVLSNKIPSLKSNLIKTARLLESKVKSGGIVAKMIGLIDKVLGGMVKFINDLFSKKGVKAVQTGLITTAGIKMATNYIGKNKEKNTPTEPNYEESDIVKDAINMGYIN
jgi:hypothetical protein